MTSMRNYCRRLFIRSILNYSYLCLSTDPFNLRLILLNYHKIYFSSLAIHLDLFIFMLFHAFKHRFGSQILCALTHNSRFKIINIKSHYEHSLQCVKLYNICVKLYNL